MLAPSFFYIPLAALAAIIEVAIINLVKWQDFRDTWRLKMRADFLVMVITFLVTLGLGIQFGIGLGIVMSIIITVRHSAFPRMRLLGQLPGSLQFQCVELLSLSFCL